MNHFVLTHLDVLVSYHTHEVDALASKARGVAANGWNEEDCLIELLSDEAVMALIPPRG